MGPAPLPAEALYHRFDPDHFDFETTADLPDLTEFIGQARAVESVRFGVGIRRKGYNLFVMGPPGSGKHSLVHQYLEQRAAGEPVPPDWVYVNNFDHPHKPMALRLPAGTGCLLRQDVARFIDELAGTLPATFQSDEYRTRIQSLEQELKERQEQAFGALGEEAEKEQIKLFRTPGGFAFAPVKDDEVVDPDEFGKWPAEERQRVEQTVATLQERLQAIIQEIPQWSRETREKVRNLNRDVATGAVESLLGELKQGYTELPAVIEWMERMGRDIVDNIREFLGADESGDTILPGKGDGDPRRIHRYKVNVMVDNGATKGAPITYSDHPTYLNLVGRAEHLAQYGTLVTDFTLLKPGALHEASGGYLLVDAHKLLTQPYAWEGLKRALYSNEIRIESLEKMLSLVSTVSLEPEAIPLDVKVVLLGEREIYYLLYEYDPDFAELFKVAADFDNRIDRSEQNAADYARLIATIARQEDLRPFDRGAVARVVEHGSRLVEDTEKLSIHTRSIADTLREADYWATEAGRETITAADISLAIEHRRFRGARVQEHIREEILRNTLLIDTAGERVGQINGLSVLSLGDHAFGQPSRVTATVHIGEGHVVDIEREVELGGPIHSKGVLILSAFLAARYAQDHPLSLSASLVFEQSYGQVDGDSASMAELCALLSAVSGLPIRQSLAMTGSVNQHGQAQPIGGVNEKIEGFFDVCAARGLTGEQGVIIPAPNVKHLMLREDVVQAAAEGRFHIYAVERVDQALELLTSAPAGEQDSEGNWTPDSINALVQGRLTEMSLIRQTFADQVREKGRDGEENEPGIKLDEGQ